MKADARDTPWPTRNDGDTTGPAPGSVPLVANAGESRSSNRLSLRIIAHLQCGHHQMYQSTYRLFVRLVLFCALRNANETPILWPVLGEGLRAGVGTGFHTQRKEFAQLLLLKVNIRLQQRELARQL